MAAAGRKPRVYLALEGGGAKGVAHVGALKALESKVEIRGIAGTSAGALVASLAAAGFTADEMVDPEKKRHLLDVLGDMGVVVASATDFFGVDGWRRIERFRAVPSRFEFRNLLFPQSLFALLPITILISISVAAWFAWWMAAIVLSIWFTLGAWLAYRLLAGLARAERFRNILDEAFRRKLRGSVDGGPVTFAEMNDKGAFPLKLVATDLTDRSLRLFSADDTPDIAVADAVTASVCLPVIFAVWKIDLKDGRPPHAFLDGGLVSNLPAWPFDEERAIDPGALTIAFEIADKKPEAEVGTLAWPVAAIRTAIFGSAVLNKRAIGRLVSLRLDSELSLLQFDATREQVFEDVENTCKAAESVIVKTIVTDPDTLTRALEAARSLTERLLATTPGLPAEAADGRPARVRASIAMPENDRRMTVKMSPCVGFEDDADEDVTLPLRGSLVGKAWRERAANFQIKPFGADVALPGPENDLRRRVIWREMTWSFSIPILRTEGLRAGTPILIVALDGNHQVSQDGAAVGRRLEVLIALINKQFRQIAADVGEG